VDPATFDSNRERSVQAGLYHLRRTHHDFIGSAMSTWEERKHAWRRRLEENDPSPPDRNAETLSGLSVDFVYGPDDPPDRSAEFPAQPPFTRGIYPNMYRGRLWTMRQYSGFGSAEETNRRFCELLDRGQTGLSMAFDLPTQMGFDPDHDMADGEVGRAGVSIASIEDMRTVFRDISLSDVSTSMTINATAPILLGMYCVLAEEQDVNLTHLRGTVQNDILKEYIARGTYIFPPEPSMRLVVDLLEFCQERLPRWNSISVSGYHIREKGATAPQEVAYTLANAVEYLRRARHRNLHLVPIARRMSFFFSAHSDFFEEVAKFRAARRLWSDLLPEKLDIEDRKARRLRFHTQTAGVSLTAQQPKNNLVRVAFQALSAVLGGTQSLHTNALDEAIGIPTEKTATLALRTQQILAHETGIPDTVDPLAGSYYVENLTDRVYHAARDIFDEVEEQGGALDAVRNGSIQNEIEQSAESDQEDIETKRRRIVGVNCYTEEEQTPDQDVQEVDPTEVERQKSAVRELREQRDSEPVRRGLDRLTDAARGEENLVPPIIECVRNRATLGEISNALRDVFGEHRSSV